MSVNDNAPTPAGFLLIDKPVGSTSHDITAAVRRTLQNEVDASASNRAERVHRIKVGHAGTLDPLATGLLLIGIGRATKLLPRLAGLAKTYEVTITLGATSATDDAEGPITENPNVKIPTPHNVAGVTRRFVGKQNQIPPPYSAKKVGGHRAYRLARRGQIVSIKPQRITIYDLKLQRYEYPELQLTVRCSAGTYLRSLARDIGQALGTGGYVSLLRRTAIGPFKVEDAMRGDSLRFDQLRRAIVPPEIVFESSGS